METISTKLWGAAFAILAIAASSSSCGGNGGGGDSSTDTTADDWIGDLAEADWGDGDGDSDSDAPDDGGQDGTACASDGDCDDGDPCTVDECDPDYEICTRIPLDADGDGYPAAGVLGHDCGGTDCDDSDDLVHPDARDCDGGADLDCSGSPDMDEDGDGWTTDECAGGDDCDDGDASIHPGAAGVDCSSVDHDCNGHADADNDGDGEDREGCPAGTDCDDADPAVRSSTSEHSCDGKDTDCNGDMHDSEDLDHDGFANSTCAAPGAEVDCDDHAAAVHPGAAESCDAVDQDCDGSWQDGGADDDLDGHLDSSCGGDDCDDSSPSVHPGAAETCGDGVDGDCDGSADGLRVLGAGPVPGGDQTMSDPGRQSIRPSLSWTGSEWAACFTVLDSGDYDVFMGRASAAGTKAGTDSGVSTGASWITDPHLAWNGSVIGLAWSDDRASSGAIFAITAAPDGVPIGSDARISDGAGYAGSPSIAWGASAFGVAWNDYRDGSGRVWFAFVSPAGVRIGSEFRLAEVAAGGSSDPAVAWTGSEFAVAWRDTRNGAGEIYLGRVGASGSVAAPDARITSATGDSAVPSIAWSGSTLGAAWVDSRSGSPEVFFAVLGPTGARVSTDTPVATLAYALEHPSSIWAGSGFVIAWTTDSGAQESVWAQAISPAGTPLGSALLLESDPADALGPSLAAGAGVLGVAWQDYRDTPSSVRLTLLQFCE